MRNFLFNLSLTLLICNLNLHGMESEKKDNASLPNREVRRGTPITLRCEEGPDGKVYLVTFCLKYIEIRKKELSS